MMMNNRYFSVQNNLNEYGDLALERHKADTSVRGVGYSSVRCPCGIWERIAITTPEGARSIGRPIGSYDTLTVARLDLLDTDGIDEARNEIAAELCSMFDERGVCPARLLVVGLGNDRLTPDSVGPLAASMVEPTLHVSEADRRAFLAFECSEIAVIAPGVAARSGLDSSITVKGVCAEIRPDAVIAIDSLAARSPERLGTTVQVSNTGIFPGTGLGHGKRAINEELLGIPVFAIGVPTVMNSGHFVGSECEGMFVSPKDINGIVGAAARIIAGGINQAFGLDNLL